MAKGLSDDRLLGPKDLPNCPEELRAQHRELYDRVFQDEPPVICRLDLAAVAAINRLYGCRGHHDNHVVCHPSVPEVGADMGASAPMLQFGQQLIVALRQQQQQFMEIIQQRQQPALTNGSRPRLASSTSVESLASTPRSHPAASDDDAEAEGAIAKDQEPSSAEGILKRHGGLLGALEDRAADRTEVALASRQPAPVASGTPASKRPAAAAKAPKSIVPPKMQKPVAAAKKATAKKATAAASVGDKRQYIEVDGLPRRWKCYLLPKRPDKYYLSPSGEILRSWSAVMKEVGKKEVTPSAFGDACRIHVLCWAACR